MNNIPPNIATAIDSGGQDHCPRTRAAPLTIIDYAIFSNSPARIRGRHSGHTTVNDCWSDCAMTRWGHDCDWGRKQPMIFFVSLKQNILNALWVQGAPLQAQLPLRITVYQSGLKVIQVSSQFQYERNMTSGCGERINKSEAGIQ